MQLGPKICHANNAATKPHSNCHRLSARDVRLASPTDLDASNIYSGKAIAFRLAQDGYDICVNDIPANQSEADAVAKEIKSTGRNAIAVAADVSNLSEVQRLVQTSVDELGPLNTMVANAGIAQVKALLDLTEQDLKRMFDINGTLTLF